METYSDVKSRCERALGKINTFSLAAKKLSGDAQNKVQRSKVRLMLGELTQLRRAFDQDINIMEQCVSAGKAPSDVTTNEVSHSLAAKFDECFYDLSAIADIFGMSTTASMDQSMPVFDSSATTNQSQSTFHLPVRSLPTFSGNVADWQAFEDLFMSILSHTPTLPDVERFEHLKTSLKGEALALIDYLPITAVNYKIAWELLRKRYGNKRDIARHHMDALITPAKAKYNDSQTIRTLVTIIQKHTAALTSMGYVTRQWSPLLLHIFEKNLDLDLRSRWELTVGRRELPSVEEFLEFLQCHLRSADIITYRQSSSKTSDAKKSTKSSNFTKPHNHFPQVLTTTLSLSCILCKQSHSIRQCQTFISKPPKERYQFAKDHHLCLNCLSSKHNTVNCSSKRTCQTCQKRHHTLLHFPSELINVAQPSNTIPAADLQSTAMLVASTRLQAVLLSTMQVDVISVDNTKHTLRALLDTGAQASFITKSCADRLSLPRRPCRTRINTFSGVPVNNVSSIMSIMLTPRGKLTPALPLDVMVVSKITDDTPTTLISSNSWPHITDLFLADPTYQIPGPVDILLGADIFPSLVTGKRISGQLSEPVAFETLFGWVLMGPTASTSDVPITSLLVIENMKLDNSLTTFWELEEPPQTKHESPDDSQAELHFTSTIHRLDSGRFSVGLPLRTPRPILGDSKKGALQRFKYLEHRFSRDKILRQQYMDFMKDYLDNEHMELIPDHEIDTPYSYYIPHHCILRSEGQTTKLRVVFDASARTTAGRSLNETLYNGRKLQKDLPSILMRARIHKYLFTADIKQMYRQIRIRAADRDYLRILWRFDKNQPISEYRLCTVTYGTSSAPYQALRTLQHLSTIEGDQYPSAAHALMHDTFVDDILTGANTEAEALNCQQELISLCAKGQFPLRKWASNSPVILQSVPAMDCSVTSTVFFDDELNTGLKILGMKWNPKHDYLSYNVHSQDTSPTKRSILSDIARIFDPLGLLCPIIFLAKYLMQLLWTTGVDWDAKIPEHISKIWLRFQQELHSLENLRIPRRITLDEPVSFELHSFSDSSEKGYAAAVYLRCMSGTTIICHLITAKSKVSPLKRVTIPRLELCGALLAAKLINHVAEVFSSRIKIEAQYAWTDSTTTLAWIQSSPHRWNTFVANRTSQIQTLTPPSIWRYVSTKDNPVDCASRGLYPTELLQQSTWWHGPNFLNQDSRLWPSPMVQPHDDLDMIETRRTVLLAAAPSHPIDDILQRFSSLPKIIRIVAYCRRIIKKSQFTSLTCSPIELAQALHCIILIVQHQSFAEYIKNINQSMIRGTPKLRGLNPFFDDHGILRVGGRLALTDLPYDQKHPILLPKSHRFTQLLIDDFHQQYHHVGTTTLHGIIQQQYWIISGRQVIKSRLNRCVNCYKLRPKFIQPLMGDLPRFRLQQVKPFFITGVDYAGPIPLKSSTGRRNVPGQAYICLFVCMTTKALHLEVASNLSTDTFLLAFSRFIARRGPVQQMHSDCGTTFKGASRLFQPVDLFTQSKEHQEKCQQYLATRNITWHFNPPSAPHFGGLWEAGVKSVKTLLHRTIGLHRLRYEELNTLLCRIEATLNSRPLGVLSTDPKDFEPLTPNHFLTLSSSTDSADPNLENVPMSKLQRWRLIKDIHSHFWRRWKNEYLHSLQRRSKWISSTDSLQLNTLVLIREPTTPLVWKLGRVLKLHPGHDGISRVATIQTSTGILKRPTVKLCPLPIY